MTGFFIIDPLEGKLQEITYPMPKSFFQLQIQRDKEFENWPWPRKKENMEVSKSKLAKSFIVMTLKKTEHAGTILSGAESFRSPEGYLSFSREYLTKQDAIDKANDIISGQTLSTTDQVMVFELSCVVQKKVVPCEIIDAE